MVGLDQLGRQHHPSMHPLHPQPYATCNCHHPPSRPMRLTIPLKPYCCYFEVAIQALTDESQSLPLPTCQPHPFKPVTPPYFYVPGSLFQSVSGVLQLLQKGLRLQYQNHQPKGHLRLSAMWTTLSQIGSTELPQQVTPGCTVVESTPGWWL